MSEQWDPFEHMLGRREDDPDALHNAEDMIRYVEQVGFVPLFKNEIPGFSVEEHAAAGHWWTGDPEKDPWEWRMQAAAGGRVAYGKFFARKAGFLSLAWLPEFVNYRRDGYDFDSRYEDGLASFRQKKIMDRFDNGEEYYSFQLRELAGFGTGGEKNFEGTVTELQMQLYLVMKDFRCRRNRMGIPYGWHIAILSTPEAVWGRELVTSAYRRKPEESRRRILQNLQERFPGTEDRIFHKIVK